MPRFFLEGDAFNGDIITITGKDVRHMRLVLRLEPGDIITVVGPGGREYQAVIVRVDRERVEARILSRGAAPDEPSLPVTLVQGLPKGDKLDFIIQKCTELGVSRVVPVSTHRSVVQLDKEKAGQRLLRWRRIAEEAAKQCGRGAIPEVAPLTRLSEALEAVPPGGLVLLPWEGETTAGIKSVMRQLPTIPPAVALLIGPEGGWEAEEVAMATRRGAVPVSLGPRILRTETAGLVALTMVLYELGDLGGCQ
ncbi:16S rRNA methyltransferase [Clostridiales bacterium PH28_bin88]|nr:16S rRNA methyltransferase [Clostridiales bacterium PH28_bin88]